MEKNCLNNPWYGMAEKGIKCLKGGGGARAAAIDTRKRGGAGI